MGGALFGCDPRHDDLLPQLGSNDRQRKPLRLLKRPPAMDDIGIEIDRHRPNIIARAGDPEVIC